MNEVQIIATVLSVDPEINPDIVAMIGASAALEVSGLPFNGPIGAARVGYIDGEYVLNPTRTQLREQSRLDLVVAGTENAVLMVESEADILSEEDMLGAVMFGHEASQSVIQAARELAQDAGKPKWDWEAPDRDLSIAEKVASFAGDRVAAAFSISDKVERQEAIAGVKEALMAEFCPEDAEEDISSVVLGEFKTLQKDVVRGRILDGNPRIDGRDTKTVRPITIQTGVLPRTHGSARFTRGETQAIVVATLGTERDAQIIDALDGEYRTISCCTTTFRPTVWEKPAASAAPKGEKSVMAVWQNAASSPWFPDRKSFPIPFVSCPKSPSRMVRVRWPACAVPVWR